MSSCSILCAIVYATPEFSFGVPSRYFWPLGMIGIASGFFFYGKTRSVKTGVEMGVFMCLAAMFFLSVSLHLER